MNDRRSPDLTLVHLTNTVDNLKADVEMLQKIPEQLATLNVSIQVLNNTLRIGSLVFIIMFPVLCTWNYFLGQSVTETKTKATAQEVHIRILEDKLTRMQDFVDNHYRGE